MIARESNDLWSLYLQRQHLDPNDLARAIEVQVAGGDLDYRTRLLIHDSMDALQEQWGVQRVASWLAACPAGREIEAIWRQQYDGDVGFSSLPGRVRDVTRSEAIHRYFRDLSRQVLLPVRLYVGGSTALILLGLLSRSTEDIDVVDEVPTEIRTRHELLRELKEVHGLELTHFQRHYLPMGWEQRLHSLPPFGALQVLVLDAYDVFLSKLFSARIKDRQDLLALEPQLDKDTLIRRFKETTRSLQAAPDLRERAEHNWYTLYGEPLPS